MVRWKLSAIFGMCLATTVLVACTSGDNSSSAFRESECRHTLPSSIDPDDVTCGTVTVAESRSERSEATIELAVAVYQATADEAASDPLVYLGGGPGGAAIASSEWLMDDRIVRRLLRDRDIVFIDQRGTGYSDPALQCPELDEDLATAAMLPSGDEAQLEADLAAFRSCRGRLVADGIDLASYNTIENASDIPEVLQSLGYREWNLYGVSYGSKLAQAIMHDHPEGIRSVILDSPVPRGRPYMRDVPGIT